ncbi:MAG TPA: 1-deoxy-D-xylulose-5-phosphate synthase, partial [Elusimicrobia bacterium]|nr:1-deoxy-D-xylulose-5-phosphate synthase [Elusimicrobiota bacterium]
MLNKIDSPADLKKLPVEQLPQIASELRAFILDTVSKLGGHLGS